MEPSIYVAKFQVIKVVILIGADSAAGRFLFYWSVLVLGGPGCCRTPNQIQNRKGCMAAPPDFLLNTPISKNIFSRRTISNMS